MTTSPALDLFTMARTTDPATSHEAAAAVDAEGQRGEIMIVLGIASFSLSGGMTADEIDEVIGWRITTAGRRLSELKARGLVEATGTQRLTRSGRFATVYRVVA